MFEVAAHAYDSYMGRYSIPLAPLFCDFVTITAGARVLDVGCGPGALTAELASRLEPSAVSAVDPSEQFVDAVRERHPEVDIARASAETLPYPSGRFDAALAQLVVHFMDDPIAGLSEMARVTRRGGVVAACVWDHGGGRGPLSRFWDVARELDPAVTDESELAGAREGHLGELMAHAGLSQVEEGPLTVGVEWASFDEWWHPFTFGVGPAGAYVASLDDEHRSRLRERCREGLPGGRLTVTARAWAARGVAGG